MNAVIRRGLVAPCIAALTTLAVWAIAGPAWALGALALGAACIIGFHLYHLQLLADWARDAANTAVPEGRGAWTQTFAAIYKHGRVRLAYERDLRYIIERFRQAAEALPDGIVVLDRTNRIEWSNACALAQLGLDPRQDIGQPIVNLVRQPEFLSYIEDGDWGRSVVVPSSRATGRSLALQIVPYAVDKKLLMSRDVTELEAVARMRRDFIANVSHELKTPLTVVSGFVETLQDMDVDPRQRSRFLQLMQEQTRSMQRLVSDLITLSSLESEQNPLADERFTVVPLMLELSNDAKVLSKGEHQVELDIGEAATLVGSREELASAFGNLVSNAIRYTPSAGKVTLAWRIDPDGRGVFSVRDTGIGIAAEHLPRLTERFYRVDRSRSRASGGTGLGLAIVKHVLLRHQAELDIESEVGRGSTFVVRLPGERVVRAPELPAQGARSSSETRRSVAAPEPGQNAR